MAPSNSNELDRLSEEWSAALARGDMNGALDVATKGYFIATSGGTHVDVMMFLGFIRHAADSLFASQARRKVPPQVEGDTCSFCQQNKPLLLRGVGVAICYDCINLAKSDTGK